MYKDTINLINTLTDYVVLDIETTGLSYVKNNDEITEICAIKISNDQVVGEFNQLINPGKHIPANITALTGIDDALVASAPRFDSIAQNFVNFIGYDVIIGHNIKFDWNGFLYAKLDNEFKYKAPNQTICTLELAKTFCTTLPNHKLGTVYKSLTGKDLVNAHRAEGDAIMTLEIFQQMQKFIQQNLKDILPNCT